MFEEGGYVTLTFRLFLYVSLNLQYTLVVVNPDWLDM